MKIFPEHLYKFKEMLTQRVPFSFTRFSDGELRILQNLDTKIGSNFYQIGDKIYIVGDNTYHPEDFKCWVPGENEFHRQKLMDAFKHKQYNYYVGLSCRCCVGELDFKKQIDWRGGDDEFLTWSNIFVNSNYPLFTKEILPLFSNYKVVYILNENADLTGLPFKVNKDFRVGFNCFINNYSLVDEIDTWMGMNKLEGYLFLFSASSLSNLIIHRLFSKYPNNTYLNIGTTLNPFLKMRGSRDYLIGGSTLRKTCIW
tara:strand:- start:9320 stop:10087 length:768 start_codon:yes stop_codon:yes gene_type:complete